MTQDAPRTTHDEHLIPHPSSLIMAGYIMESLTTFCSQYQPQAVEQMTWDALRLQVTSYLCARLPPNAFITSVRAIVCNEHAVLVVRDPDGAHILPGGRREVGETLEQTLRREVLEETGWEIEQLHLPGVLHYHHLDPKPADYPYLYPDFLQVIYRATPGRYLAHARHTHCYELDAFLTPLTNVDALPLSSSDRMFLIATRRMPVL
jgi:8-oxo-dGTP pyrophosphatase MutT (NUDIX family)